MLRTACFAAALVASAFADGYASWGGKPSACDASSLVTQHEGSRKCARLGTAASPLHRARRPARRGPHRPPRAPTRCAYTDTTGHRTVGVGFNLDADGAQKAVASVGAYYKQVYSGDVCLTSDQVDGLLQISLRTAEGDAASVVSSYGSLCCGVQVVITDLVFNMGAATLGTFTDFLGYINAGQWGAASSDLKQTEWCGQVGDRCNDDAGRIGSGC